MSETPGSLLTSPASMNPPVKEICEAKPKDLAKIKEEQAAEFQLVEYRESANAYFKGVEIGFTGLKGYITINVLFATALGLLVNPNASSIFGATDVGKLVPSFALLASIGFILTFPHYFNHLENCRMRCQKLESRKGRSSVHRPWAGRIPKIHSRRDIWGYSGHHSPGNVIVGISGCSTGVISVYLEQLARDVLVAGRSLGVSSQICAGCLHRFSLHFRQYGDIDRQAPAMGRRRWPDQEVSRHNQSSSQNPPVDAMRGKKAIHQKPSVHGT